MRTLLAIVMTIGLILNSGSGLITAASAKAALGAMGSAHAHPMASHPKMHRHSAEMGDCNQRPSKSPAHRPKCCCDKDTKCTQGACLCLKCFSVFADVVAVSHTGIGAAALFCPDACDKPPGSVRQPPAPPPQS